MKQSLSAYTAETGLPMQHHFCNVSGKKHEFKYYNLNVFNSKNYLKLKLKSKNKIQNNILEMYFRASKIRQNFVQNRV